jgi:hypothetical protein
MTGLFLSAFAGAGLAQQPTGKLSAAELKKLARTHDTPADHQKLARHYEAVAAEHEAEAAEHEALAAEYTRQPTGQGVKHPMSAQTAEHCKVYAQHCRNVAKEARALSAEHAALAKAHK